MATVTSSGNLQERIYQGELQAVDDHDGEMSATLWMSEAAMTRARISSGQLVALSLSGSASPFGLVESLQSLCCSRFGVQCGDTAGIGGHFALAVVLPSRKLLKDYLRFSRSLSDSMGCPASGTAVYICSLSIECLASATGKLITSSLARAAGLGATVYICTHLVLTWLPPMPGTFAPKAFSSLDEATSVKAGLKSPLKVVSSPPSVRSGSGADSTKKGSYALSEDHDIWALTSRISAWACFAEGGEQVRAMLQNFALRWLSDRFVLPGSLLVLPICGCDCVFSVSAIEYSSPIRGQPDRTQELKLEDLSRFEEMSITELPSPLTVFHVSKVTRVTLSAMTNSSVTKDEEKHLQKQPQEQPTGIGKCDVKFSDLGGLSDQIQVLRDIVELPMLQPAIYTRYGLQFPRGVLLFGPSGTGKTSLARAAAFEAGCPLFVINGPEIVQEYYGGSEDALTAIFSSAARSAPSVVFIDEIDAIAPKRKDGNEELAHRMVSTLLTLLDGGGKHNLNSVTVIGATNRLEALDPALRRPGRFDREIEVGVPTPAGRRDILRSLMKYMSHSLGDEELQALAADTHGFVGADLTALCNEAAMTALRRYVRMKQDVMLELQEVNLVEESHHSCLEKLESLISNMRLEALDLGLAKQPNGDQPLQKSVHSPEADLRVGQSDFANAKTKVRPSAMREVMLEVPEVRWCDIGGQEVVKQQLREIVEWPQKHEDAFSRLGIRPPRGVLLYGPPGCSKTLMARAVAAEAGLNFVAVKGPELFSKWVGESEKAVSTLFARARASSPSIIFFDEIDGLAGDREGSYEEEVSVGSRVITQLLVELDGLRPSNGVLIIAATNRPDKLDRALLRPGRFDRKLFVGPPDKAAREEIFRIHLRSVPCSPDVSITGLAVETNGYTGADIAALCREAALASLEEDLLAEQVCVRHFQSALHIVVPSEGSSTDSGVTTFQGHW